MAVNWGSILMGEDWGQVLGQMIARTEGRVTSWKQRVQQAYKAGDRDLVDLFKECQHDEERFLKRLRKEKTCWNDGAWEWILRQDHTND